MEIAAVSTTVGGSGATVSALGKERNEERKARARETAGTKTVVGGMSNVSKGGLSRFVATVDTCWKWGHKKAQRHHWQGRRPMELEQWYHPGSSVSQRVQAVNSSPVPPVCWSYC